MICSGKSALPPRKLSALTLRIQRYELERHQDWSERACKCVRWIFLFLYVRSCLDRIHRGLYHSGVQVAVLKLRVNFTSLVSPKESVAYCPLGRWCTSLLFLGENLKNLCIYHMWLLCRLKARSFKYWCLFLRYDLLCTRCFSVFPSYLSCD